METENREGRMILWKYLETPLALNKNKSPRTMYGGFALKL